MGLTGSLAFARKVTRQRCCPTDGAGRRWGRLSELCRGHGTLRFGKWNLDRRRSLFDKREFHSATLLPNGKVLVAGGYNGSTLASAELYDSASGSWTRTGSLANERDNHTATLLPNGKVLVAGGMATPSSYLSRARNSTQATRAADSRW